VIAKSSPLETHGLGNVERSLSILSSGEASRAPQCPIGAAGAQIAPKLEPGENLVTPALYFVYDFPSQPDQSLSIQERDTLIRARHATGVSQADLARQFGISYQRVHQNVRGETRQASEETPIAVRPSI
jgi:hypothetical protein